MEIMRKLKSIQFLIIVVLVILFCLLFSINTDALIRYIFADGNLYPSTSSQPIAVRKSEHPNSEKLEQLTYLLNKYRKQYGSLSVDPDNNNYNNNNNNNNKTNLTSIESQPLRDLFGKGLLGFLNYPVSKWDRLNTLINHKAVSSDPELVDFVRGVLDPPSSKVMIKMSRGLMKTPQAEEIEKLLNEMRKGFFIEAGALDGERSSNTIYFEEKLGWTGLLVEMDPFFYTQLMGKNRHAWSINACISPTDFVTKLTYRDSSGGQGRLDLSSRSSDKKFQKYSTIVPCFPVETMLLALNKTKIDFFSLDVEGVELEILQTIPFDKLDITSLAVEYGHGDKGKYLDFMDKKGYRMVKDIHMSNPLQSLYVEDYIFIKKNFTT